MKRIEFEVTISGQGTEIRRIPDVGAIRFEDGEFKGLSFLECVEVVDISKVWPFEYGCYLYLPLIIIERSNGIYYKIVTHKKGEC